ncbi:MAG: glycosyltransferase family 2 protein [Thermoleophilia bacterium]|nr:glycosyltransferase family 2 protein [Thermoleophilia bacterium]
MEGGRPSAARVDGGGGVRRVRLVAIALVRNEDAFVERAIRNVASACDRIHVVDHVSSDRTWDVVRDLARELDHLDVRRARHTRVSHEVLQPYMGTSTWALRVDGDEIYDPHRLVRVREALDAGAFRDVFRVQANVLHCVSLDAERTTATGYLSPPSRPVTALFNLGAVDSWRGAVERLEGGEVAFRQGYGWQAVDALPDRYSWDESPLRYLHVCFLRRSSRDPDGAPPRRTLTETGEHRRGALGWAIRHIRPPRLNEQIREIHARGSSWKIEKYRRGPQVEVDASPFFGRADASRSQEILIRGDVASGRIDGAGALSVG